MENQVVEVRLRRKDVGYQEVEQSPQLVQVVLQRRARDQHAELRRDRPHGLDNDDFSFLMRCASSISK